MKIKKFNESYGRKATDKILKVTINTEFEVNIETIRNTDKFIRYGKKDPFAPNNWKEEDLFYGIEEYIKDIDLDFNYKLYDGLGNPIEDEPAFDKYVKYTKNYNL